jgi:hypothetical protein
MSDAVLEMTAEVQAREQAFKMPRPARGQQIVWFPDADRKKTPEVGFVREVANRSLTILLNGGAYDTVRHVDDPLLLRNEFQRVNGAWDFAENDRDVAKLKEQVCAMERKIAELEDLIVGGKKGK